VKTWHVIEVDGYRILVGRSAHANDELTFDVASPRDLWLHVQGASGSHVIVTVPEDAAPVPRSVVSRAAELAAYHSKARASGRKVPVHVARVGDVIKERGAPAGQVSLRRYETVKVYPRGPDQVETGV
jgi:predicted ribosome quality control (RQC) complex YloA/Tae2 family protein